MSVASIHCLGRVVLMASSVSARSFSAATRAKSLTSSAGCLSNLVSLRRFLTTGSTRPFRLPLPCLVSLCRVASFVSGDPVTTVDLRGSSAIKAHANPHAQLSAAPANIVLRRIVPISFHSMRASPRRLRQRRRLLAT